MKTLTQLRIDHFRGIRDLNIEHLTSINVIVGDNNCGKTSVMEAIQFLCSGSPANIYNIARLRDRTLTFFLIRCMTALFVCFPKTMINCKSNFRESMTVSLFPMCFWEPSQKS